MVRNRCVTMRTLAKALPATIEVRQTATSYCLACDITSRISNIPVPGSDSRARRRGCRAVAECYDAVREREDGMEIKGRAMSGIGTSDLSESTRFATDWLGMQMVERGNTARAFRMDDRSQRLVVDRSLADGERYFGFEVADATALQALATRPTPPVWQ